MYYPLLKNSNNEMKALRELKETSRNMIIPIIESKRIKKENISNWEGTFNTLGRYLKERVKNIKFIYDFNCAFEDIGTDEVLTSTSGESLVEHCINKMQEQNLNLVPCFQHDSPDWLIKEVLVSGYNNIAIRIRCHDFQKSLDSFVYDKIKKDIAEALPNIQFTVILDFSNKITSIKRIENAINIFSNIPNSEIVYLSTSCPEDASEAEVHAITLVAAREDLNNYLKLKSIHPDIKFGDYTTRLQGEILKGFNHNNSYLKIFYSSETDYYIAKSKLIKNGGEETFNQVCQELIDQDFYPGEDFSFGDQEIKKCADKKTTIGDHQRPIAIGVNHHIETTIEQLLR